MKIFNSAPKDVVSVLKATTNNYAKAIDFAQRGQTHKATRVLNSALDKAHSSGFVTTENARITGDSGIGTGCDFTSSHSFSLEGTQSAIEILYKSEILYYTDWQAQKIIDIPVIDMLKKSFYYSGVSDDDNKKLLRYQQDLNFYSVLTQALKMERLYGGAVIFMGILSELDDTAEPLDIDKIKEGDLVFMNALSRLEISATEIQTNPILPFYGRPQYYTINGQRVHRSRLLIFDGQPLKNLKRGPYFGVGLYQYNDHFGYPLLARLFDDLGRATGSRQAAMHLIERASVMLFSGDIQSASAFKDSQDNINTLKTLVNNMSNYKAALINSIPGSESTLSTVAANFGSVPELMLMYVQMLSAAGDLPAIRFLGQAPGGLNATGEYDLIQYEDTLTAKQEHHVKPQLTNFLEVLAPSAGITEDPRKIEIIFPPIRSSTEQEMASIRQIDSQNIVSLVASNIISQEEGIEELVQKDVLSTDPKEFADPLPLDFDDTDQDTAPDTDNDIDKRQGDEGDDSRIAKTG